MVSTEKIFNREYINLESYQLIWLNCNSNEQNSSTNKIISLSDLRKIIDYTKCFDNMEECFDYINKTQDCKTLLVSTDESIVSNISNYEHPKNLLGIYVLCNCKDKTDRPKNIRVYTNLDDLLKDLSIVANNKLNLPDFTTDDLYQTWWADFIDILCYITYPADSLNKLVTALQEYYKGNQSEITKLARLELEYKSDNPIFWYTQDTCIYRVLNKALRQHHIELMFLFGFYVQDLFRQLTAEHERFRSLTESDNFKIKMYRSQIMSKNEIELLKHRIGLDIITNSLLSTSSNRQFALFILESSISTQLDSNLQSVLFEIQADLRINSRPFADISRLSHFSEECEILFAIGTEFQVIDINFADNIWIINLQLNNNSFKYKEILKNFTMKKCFIICVEKLVQTFKSPSLDEIDKIFDGLQQQCPLEKWILAAKYYRQAEYHRNISKNYEIAAPQYKHALNIWLEYYSNNTMDELNCSFHIGTIYERVGYLCHYMTNNNIQTKKISHNALKYYEQALTSELIDNFERIKVLSFMAEISEYIADLCSDDNDEKTQEYLNIIKYRKLSLEIMSKCYLSTNVQFANIYQRLADVYKTLKDYDKATDSYIKALDIQLQQDVPTSIFIIDLCEHIIEIDLMLERNYERQLKYQLIKHDYILKDKSEDISHNSTTYYQEKLGNSHTALARTYMILGEHHLCVKHQELAKDHLKTVEKLY